MKILVMLLASLFTLSHNTYPMAMQVVAFERETDTVVCCDATGLEWAFYGIEDWEVGDLVIAMMDDNGTRETLVDDIITDVTYSGYTFPPHAYDLLPEGN